MSKQIKGKRISIFILILLLLSIFSNNVYAVESQQDGLIVNLNSDKESYEENEEVLLDISIRNNNNNIIVIDDIETITPESFKIISSDFDNLKDYEIQPNEVLSFKTLMKQDKIQMDNTSFEKEDKVTEDIVEQESQVKTGDETEVVIWVILIIGSASIFCFTIKIKKNKIQNTLILCLVVSLSATLFYKVNVVAKENIKTLVIENYIDYNGEKKVIKSIISYTNGGLNPKEPVIYQDGVEETFLDYVLDEDKNEIIVSGSEEVNKWGIGEIHVLKNNLNEQDDIAIKIDSIKQLDNGDILINYTTPDITEVVKEVDYFGSQMQDGIFIPAQGITVGEPTDDANMSRSMLKGNKISGKFPLFKKMKINIPVPEGEVYAILEVERINYEIKMKANLIPTINLFKLTLDSSFTLGVDVESDFGGERKVLLGSCMSSLGYGFFAEGKLYCYISASGEIELEYTLNATCGFKYYKNKLSGVWQMDNELTKARANANVKGGVTFEPTIELFKIDLIGAEFDYGRNYELKTDNVSIDPLEYCVDAGYYNYASIDTIFFPGKHEKRATTSLIDKGNSIIKEYHHLEEIGFVDKCTRMYGSLEGFVKKHDGNEFVPLLDAKVVLKQDGKEIHATTTDTGGKFYFGKEIKKGKYDIIVTSNHYDMYEGKVEIKGNKENKLDDIILEPANKTIVVSGVVIDMETKQPIINAVLEVEGNSGVVSHTDDVGYYSLDVPLGQHTIIIKANGYEQEIYSDKFKEDISNLNIELTSIKVDDVFTVNAGENYRFIKNEIPDTNVAFRAMEASVISYYNESSEGSEMGIEYKTQMNKGEEIYFVETLDLTVYSGSIEFYSEDNTEENVSISKVCTIEKLDHEAVLGFTLNEGNYLRMENTAFYWQFPTYYSVRFYAKGTDDLNYTETITDYWWNKYIGWDIGITTNIESGYCEYWTGMDDCTIREFTVQSGTLYVYLPYKNKDKLVFNFS